MDVPNVQPPWFGAVMETVQKENKSHVAAVVAAVQAENRGNWDKVAGELKRLNAEQVAQRKDIDDLKATQQAQAVKQDSEIAEVREQIRAMQTGP